MSNRIGAYGKCLGEWGECTHIHTYTFWGVKAPCHAARSAAVLEKRGPKSRIHFLFHTFLFPSFLIVALLFLGPVMDFPWISDVSGNRKHAGYLPKTTGPSVVGR